MKQNTSNSIKNVTTLLFIITLISTISCASFCDYCQCYNEVTTDDNKHDEEVFRIVNCNGNELVKRAADDMTTAYKMQMLEWPASATHGIIGRFNHLNLTVLPRLENAASNKVIVLNFDNNAIQTIGSKPFQYFENLREISMRSNFISDLPKDFLYGLRQLDRLSLSNNSITEISNGFLPETLTLKSIDLSHNLLTTLSSNFAKNFRSVREIDLSFNRIYVINSFLAGTKCQVMNLAGNQLKVLGDSTFADFVELRELDLSRNAIVEVEKGTFEKLEHLKKLNIEGNELQGIILRLPSSLEELRMGNNSLRLWPMEETPKNLTYLDVHGNELNEIFVGHELIPNLKTLNISRNVIDAFPYINFTHLSILDLSGNSFTEVPKHLPLYVPLLEQLIMDNNPLSSLKLSEKMRLSKLSFRNMPFIESIDALTFSNVEGAKVRHDGSSTCVDIYVSHCDKLESVSDDAFLGVHLCYLDLSYNQIRKLPNNLTEWHRLEDGINLQGNPLHCDCESQWMLDDILNHLYAHTKHQHLLSDLRCHDPNFKNQRLVRFYNRLNAFCDPPSSSEGKFAKYLMASDSDEPQVQAAGVISGQRMPTYIIIIIGCFTVLLLIIISGVYLTRIQEKKLAAKNRRYFAY
ncbi:leucine-rich repeats and immunoglobulin-like domains protein 2 [Culicoides brevitarsis]|uniref:leucine-rich repeats and immunoglobulin-like domains protein 2 n=1 Tax=Culicoides brevitarsis TaxID=469753 RepID=UPI00307BAE38